MSTSPGAQNLIRDIQPMPGFVRDAWFRADPLGGGDIVIRHRQREVGAAQLASLRPKSCKSLRRRDFVDQMAINKNQRGAVVALDDRVVVPNLFVQGAGAGHVAS